jgi:hypothetical protein
MRGGVLIPTSMRTVIDHVAPVFSRSLIQAASLCPNKLTRGIARPQNIVRVDAIEQRGSRLAPSRLR